MNDFVKQQIDKIHSDCKKLRPHVVIRCIAYNQEKYIKEALEGFIMQKTKFPFVAIVHDDASTDSTARIIKEYAEKYPEIIKPIYETENQYSKKDGSLTRTMNDAMIASGAEYIAFCEGDDYWTDPLKLQKQIDFLEANPDYVLCFHEAAILDKMNSGFVYPKLFDREYGVNEIFENWIVPTASIVMKQEVRKSLPENKFFVNGDIIVLLTAASIGKLYGMAEKMAVYRINSEGLTISRLLDPLSFYSKEEKHFKAIGETFPQVSRVLVAEKLSNTNINWGISLLKRCKVKGFIKLFRGLLYSPRNFFSRIIAKI